jgi:hypothetical protein
MLFCAIESVLIPVPIRARRSMLVRNLAIVGLALLLSWIGTGNQTWL